MYLEIIIPSEVSQTEKDKSHMMLLICRILKMIQANLFPKQKLTDLEKETLVTKTGREEGND